MNLQYRVLAEKLKEAAASVLPVTAIVAVCAWRWFAWTWG